ncbi:alpha/beta fold hydrolase [Paenibacillus sp. 1P07SE]|uniref:alpha/beta fold hydrolase n=1 Tax=Paenibacillus sp. 1P07SE TaxID=3132209 RepID=UPI0039A536C3
MSTYVLVHGSWHGAWCWEKIVPQLEQAGHRVLAVELPGNGTDDTPVSEVTLESGVNKTLELLDKADEPVVLVGHSMGGVTISQVAEERPDKVQALVYVTAFMLADGQSLLNIPTDEEGLLAPNMIPSEDGSYVTVPRPLLTEIFYACCDPADAERAIARFGVQSLGPLPTPLKLTEGRYGRIPRYYVACRRDRAITHRSQQEMIEALPCKEVYTLDVDHSPFYSAPDQLTGILTEIGGKG